MQLVFLLRDTGMYGGGVTSRWLGGSQRFHQSGMSPPLSSACPLVYTFT